MCVCMCVCVCVCEPTRGSTRDGSSRPHKDVGAGEVVEQARRVTVVGGRHYDVEDAACGCVCVRVCLYYLVCDYVCVCVCVCVCMYLPVRSKASWKV